MYTVGMDDIDKPIRTVQEIIEALRAKGLSSDQLAAIADIAAKRSGLAPSVEHVIEIPQDDSMAVVIAKLDKLQESVDSLAAKLDAEDLA